MGNERERESDVVSGLGFGSVGGYGEWEAVGPVGPVAYWAYGTEAQ